MKNTALQTPEQSYQIMKQIMSGSLSTLEIVSILKYYQKHKPNEQHIRSLLAAIKDSAEYKIYTSQYKKPVIDISGTGGDGQHTINISTLASIFCAATKLVNVAKYGNRAATSICGSMDVLNDLGIQIELTKNQVHKQLANHNFAPIFARCVYLGAKYAAPARSKIKSPTIFNLLFPLARPIFGEPKFLFGVADPKLIPLITKVYKSERKTRCALVHGYDGSDELSISNTGETQYTLVDNGKVRKGIINCKKLFNIDPIDPSYLKISCKHQALRLFILSCNPNVKSLKILNIRNAVYANAALALFIALDHGDMDVRSAAKYIPILKKSVESGKAYSLINQLS